MVLALVALGQIALVVPGTPLPVRAAMNAPLVLVLPGLAWMSLLRTARLDLATRLVLSVACTLILVIFTGLVLNVTKDGLSTQAWMLSLGVLTVIPAVIRLCSGDTPGTPPRIPVRVLLLALPWAAALAGLVLAFDLAQYSATERRDPGFTQLWLEDEVGNCAGRVRVGVVSFEREPVDFNLTVLADHERVAEHGWPGIQPDQRVEATVAINRPAASVIEVRLSRSDRADDPYRWTRLACGGAASSEALAP